MEEQLTSVLNVSREVAQRLLREAGGDVETAIALHFSTAQPAQALASGSDSPRSQLRAIVGGISQPQATALLRKAGGSVEAAADLYFSRLEAGPSRAVPRAPSEPISLDDDSDAAAEAGAARVISPRGRPGTSGHAAAQSPSGRRLSSGQARSAGATRTQPAGQQRAATAVAPQPEAVPESTEDDSDDDDATSDSDEEGQGMPGLVGGSDAVQPPAARLPGRLPAPLLGALLNRFFQLVPAMEDSNDEEMEEEVQEERIVARNTGNAQVTQKLPSLQAAAASRVHSQVPLKIPAQLLPLPNMRDEAGQLHCDSEDKVPVVVAPKAAAARLPLKLGSLLLPLYWIQPELQSAPLALVWESKQGEPHHSFQVNWRSTAFLPLATAQGLMPQSSCESNTRFKLCSNNSEEAVAMVWEPQSWVSEALFSLFVLQQAGLVTWTLRLDLQPGPADVAGAASSPAGAKPGRGSKPKAAGTPNGSKGKQAATPAKVHVSGRKAPGRGKCAASASGQAKPEEQAGPSSGAKPGANAAADGSQQGRPTHARLEIVLTQKVAQLLWWAEESCNFGDVGDEEDNGGKKKGHGGKKGAQLNRWKKNGTALSKLVAAVLSFGEGLRLGPDSDGLLNFGDTPPEAWEALPADKGSPAYRKLFDVQSLLDSVKVGESAQGAVAPAGLLAHPKHYQLQGLQWMLDRERRGDAVGRGHLHLHPEWLQLITADGRPLYFHRLAPHVLSDRFYAAPVGGTCGGFLCDEMGLGKTLESLMLIMSNPAPAGWAVSKLDGITVGGDEGEQAIPIKTTLIVVPSNLLGQWADEIERHLHPGALTWCTYKPGLKPSKHAGPVAAAGPMSPAKRGQRRSRRVQDREHLVEPGQAVKPVWCETPEGRVLAMHQADVCLMSYESLRDELHSVKGSTSVLQQYGFWRVMLDEAQLVANSSSVAAIMASSLWRRHAWVVTGTPISARLDEVKGLLEFLAYEPFYRSAAWRGLVQGEFSERGVAGLLSMRALLRGVMLRRCKADVAAELELPPCTREDRWVPLSSVERLVYEQAKRSFVDAAFQVNQQHAAAQHQGFRARQGGNRAIGRAMQALTALRQSCCHPQIVRRQDDLLGKERLSMREIMERLVTQAYVEWDSQVRNLITQKAILAGVLCGNGGHPGEALRPLLELVRQNREAAFSSDIRQQASQRRMDGSLAQQEPPPAGAGGTAAAAAIELGQAVGSGAGALTQAGPSGAAAGTVNQTQGQQQQQQQQLELQPASRDEKGKGPAVAELLSTAAAAPAPYPQSNGILTRKRRREGSSEPSGSGAGPTCPAAALEGNGKQQGEPSNGQQEQRLLLPGEGEDMSEEERRRFKEARRRLRGWQAVELDMLELYRHLLELAKDPAKVAKLRIRKKPKAGEGAGTSAAARQQAYKEDEWSDDEKPSKPRSSKRAKTKHGSAAATAAAPMPPPDLELLEAELQEASSAIEAVQAQLGWGDGPAMMRRSKRQAGVEVEEEIVVGEEDAEALEEQLLDAKVILRNYHEAIRRKNPEKSARVAVAAAEKEAGEKWHHLQHLLNKETALIAAEKGKAAAASDEGDGSGPAGAADSGGAAADGAGASFVQQEDLNSCPICLDELTTRTITACGHHYCSTCIREVLAHGRRNCPICRAEIRESDLFDACSEEEARLKEQAAAAGGATNADYGSKVSALLTELATMRSADPEAKAVVFSSWGRLLKLVGHALEANGIQYASLCGANLQQRQEALHRFTHDPSCMVLTVVMSTSGGAAGLTLTVASTAFILEPTLNPGLEQQAAARIYRLGQTKPTRVIRLLAQDTVEARILDTQRRKLESGEAPAETALQEVDAGMLLQLYEAVK